MWDCERRETRKKKTPKRTGNIILEEVAISPRMGNNYRFNWNYHAINSKVKIHSLLFALRGIGEIGGKGGVKKQWSKVKFVVVVGGWYERIAVTVQLRLRCFHLSLNLLRSRLSRPCRYQATNFRLCCIPWPNNTLIVLPLYLVNVHSPVSTTFVSGVPRTTDITFPHVNYLVLGRGIIPAPTFVSMLNSGEQKSLVIAGLHTSSWGISPIPWACICWKESRWSVSDTLSIPRN